MSDAIPLARPEPTAAVLRCEGLRVGYGGTPLLPPIDVEVRAGEFWAVVGRNGSGKSTWFRTLLGLQPPVGGRIVWPSGDPRISYVPQRTGFDDLYPILARHVVAMGIDRGWSFLRPSLLRESPEVGRALGAVGAGDLADRTFRSLSEGQKQRVLLARLVVSGARLVLLDEPTAAMDVVAEAESLRMLDELRRRYGMATIVVSHYLGVARDFADRVILLDRDEQEVVVGTPREVFEHSAFRSRYGEPEDLLFHG